jgi:uncharacterized protein YwgA
MSGKVLSGKRIALLLLLYARGSSGELREPIEGRTRLQKMLYLLNKEHRVVRQINSLKFEAYAYGPYSADLYDDLAFLDNMHYLSTGASSEIDADELTENDVTFDYLMGGLQEELPERYETTKYALSAKGVEVVQEYKRGAESDPKFNEVVEAIEKVKTQFNRMPLHELIRYVYSRYPEDARESVIADRS